ncbi:nitroreductase family protein [Marinivivus vitaminiproducens]|uniref:nitroreductase family protein n=1 Tax=Marinivivus vitaminiproducens TaxID=3035935 RepID=UPI00279A0C75|nr:nitroreductase family protein [Geminicoccaceae bacterium SCSIO 64248]
MTLFGDKTQDGRKWSTSSVWVRTLLNDPAAFFTRASGLLGRVLQRAQLMIWSRSPLLSSAYYGLLSRTFAREHFAVMQGRLSHRQNQITPGGSSLQLRRNVHRLEKGLIMRPRRPVFAADYIVPTVAAYARLVEGLPRNPEALPEVEWARDVLQTYFDAVGPHADIDRARARFGSIEVPVEAGQRTPYRRDLERPTPVAYDAMLELAQRRRSVRWYLQQPVPRDLIDQAVAVAAQAPSACNRQPFTFRVYDDPALVRQVAEVPMGTRGFAQNFPAIVVIVGQLRAYFNERDRHVIYVDASLAAMSFMFALETLGLSSCSINWPDQEPQESRMRELLNLEADERVVMLVSLGYPDPTGEVPYSGKKSIDLLRSYNRQ